MSAEEDRARARKSWPIVRRSLHDADDENLSDSTTVEERLAMMWPLAVTSWTLAGGIPDYPRSQTPIRILYRRKP
jgi:hypothetical protein